MLLSIIRFIMLPALTISLSNAALSQEVNHHFYSACDFNETEVEIISQDGSETENIKVRVVLNSEAARKLELLTRKNLGNSLSIYINGEKITTATIQNELKGGVLQFTLNQRLATKLVPGLLRTSCRLHG